MSKAWSLLPRIVLVPIILVLTTFAMNIPALVGVPIAEMPVFVLLVTALVAYLFRMIKKHTITAIVLGHLPILVFTTLIVGIGSLSLVGQYVHVGHSGVDHFPCLISFIKEAYNGKQLPQVIAQLPRNALEHAYISTVNNLGHAIFSTQTQQMA